MDGRDRGEMVQILRTELASIRSYFSDKFLYVVKKVARLRTSALVYQSRWFIYARCAQPPDEIFIRTSPVVKFISRLFIFFYSQYLKKKDIAHLFLPIVLLDTSSGYWKWIERAALE